MRGQHYRWGEPGGRRGQITFAKSSIFDATYMPALARTGSRSSSRESVVNSVIDGWQIAVLCAMARAASAGRAQKLVVDDVVLMVVYMCQPRCARSPITSLKAHKTHPRCNEEDANSCMKQIVSANPGSPCEISLSMSPLNPQIPPNWRRNAATSSFDHQRGWSMRHAEAWNTAACCECEAIACCYSLRHL